MDGRIRLGRLLACIFTGAADAERLVVGLELLPRADALLTRHVPRLLLHLLHDGAGRLSIGLLPLLKLLVLLPGVHGVNGALVVSPN